MASAHAQVALVGDKHAEVIASIHAVPAIDAVDFYFSVHKDQSRRMQMKMELGEWLVQPFGVPHTTVGSSDFVACCGLRFYWSHDGSFCALFRDPLDSWKMQRALAGDFAEPDAGVMSENGRDVSCFLWLHDGFKPCTARVAAYTLFYDVFLTCDSGTYGAEVPRSEGSFAYQIVPFKGEETCSVLLSLGGEKPVKLLVDSMRDAQALVWGFCC
tara:strand:- start:704 stop:1345 length:642 start_codon:yes stop_codon:yes gene_type:complete